ncbi:MAG: hypothetical protein KJ879_00485 [Nanoarchaeota archaeon]|nr:hypothetical protein [Nanoarchaeota archaeon]
MGRSRRRKKKLSSLDKKIIIGMAIGIPLFASLIYFTEEYREENLKENYPEMYEGKPKHRENNQSVPDLSERVTLGNYHERIFYS